MSLGPIFGRKDGQRTANSYLGAIEVHTALKGGTSADGVNVYDSSPTKSTSSGGSTGDGIHVYGIRSVRQLHSAVMYSMYRGSGHGTNWNGRSTHDHRVYNSGADNSMSTTETFGGGTVGQTRGNRYELNYANQNDTGHIPQSNYPYVKRINTLMDAHINRIDQMSGHYFGNGSTPLYRNSSSLGVAWSYRQIISLTYTCGGYKDSDPWKSVHRTNHANDQTTNLGDQMDYDGNYISGGCSDTTAFVWSTPTDNAANTASTRTSAVHMYTETGKSHNSVFDLYDARQDLGTSQDLNTFAFIAGGPGPNQNIMVFNLVTDCRQTSVGSSSGGMSGGTGAGSFDGKNYGYLWDDDNGQIWNKYTWSGTSAPHYGAHGQQKGITGQSYSIGYCGNEGSYNNGYNFRRWNTITNSQNSTISKPVYDQYGEENFGRGHDWQYMVGNYDGAQNNEHHRFVFSTESATAPSGGAPSAHAGQSSGHCMWRA